MDDEKRLFLHEKLVDVIGEDNRRNVYFQPPASIQLSYPCIIYSRRSGNTYHADDKPYVFVQIYDVTVIDRNPDSMLSRRLAESIPGARFDRHWTADNLHHDNFSVPCYITEGLNNE